jgi:hypothetical protein
VFVVWKILYSTLECCLLLFDQANTTVAEHLITHNAKAPKEAKWAAPRFEAKLSKKEAPPPSSASYDYATKKSARKSTVPRRSSGGSPAVSESGAGGASAPPSPTPQSTSEEATAAAGVPSARSEEGAVEAAVGGGVGGGAWGLPRRLGGSQGYANHKRAARVPAGPPQGLAPPPQLASAMGTARSNDPKTYKSVPHEWTCMIVVSLQIDPQKTAPVNYRIPLPMLSCPLPAYARRIPCCC